MATPVESLKVVTATTLLVAVALILGCGFTDIEDLTCESLVQKTVKLSQENEYPIVEITDVQEVSRLDSKLNCKGSAHLKSGDTLAINFYVKESNGDRRYG